ncbi:universal stress protein [Ancylobacter sp. WKF20]|uniref:universal stress protein n=1 Tax=Ancylobacter sp. WKF20 TaxID=3039801 RepID=UPI0024345180|nr:universal stress protein [Ancylobacter sp. WKF20]WGD29423.1 universal stress protein [Ancylobacter sp. WKF20]
MPRTRQSFAPGHRRKFLVMVDGTPECDRAVTYAARRAARTQGGLVLLAVLELTDAPAQWLGVANLMRAEETDKAEMRLAHYVARARSVAGVEAETVIREGSVAEALHAVVEADEDIAILALASAAGSDGPGPLLTALVSGHWALPIPITIVPGTLTDADIEALA